MNARTALAACAVVAALALGLWWLEASHERPANSFVPGLRTVGVAAAAERERAAEAWAARVAELQEALTRTSKELETAKAAHRESDEQWAQRERRLREQLIEVSDEVDVA